MDVGHNASQSTRVTQGDLDQMAAAADRAPSGAPAIGSSVPAYAPQNSLQAQAQAISNGNQLRRAAPREPGHCPARCPAQPAQSQETASPRARLADKLYPLFCRSSAHPCRPSHRMSRQLGLKRGRKG